jgi:hypothetical protein
MPYPESSGIPTPEVVVEHVQSVMMAAGSHRRAPLQWAEVVHVDT